MSPNPQPPHMKVVEADDYRETYSNSMLVKMSTWDFQLVFGTLASETPEQVVISNHQAVIVSPQQAKAVFNLLGQHLAQYEATFGPINLEPQPPVLPEGPIN